MEEIFPSVEIDFFAKVINVNTYGEHILHEIGSYYKSNPSRLLLEAIQNNKKTIKTSSGEYGLKVISHENHHNVIMIPLMEYIGNIDDHLDISSFKHELSNPLTVILGTSQILKRKSDCDYTIKCADVLQAECRRITRILENMSFLSDIRIEPSAFSFASLINEVYDAIKVLWQEPEIRISIDPAMTEMVADKEMLYIAIFNIVKNACQAKQQVIINISASIDSSIKYHFRETGENVALYKISISDNAGGIDKGILDKLFTPFVSTKKGGSGLGLVISKGIVEKHGGRLDVISNFAGGAQFNILIPCIHRPCDDE